MGSPLNARNQTTLEAGGLAPKKAKSIGSAGKVMASVFWDAKGILLFEHLEKGKYYSNLLDQLDVKNLPEEACLA